MPFVQVRQETSMSGWPKPPQVAENGNAGTALVTVNRALPSTPSPSPSASSRLRLSTIADCKRDMRRSYIAARNSEMSISDAGKFVWMLSTLANLIADHDIEDRLEALERK